MLIFIFLLFGCSMFLVHFPKLMLFRYRGQMVGLDKVLETAPESKYDSVRVRLRVALLPFGAFFIGLVVFGSIPNWQPVAFVSPAFAALVKGIIDGRLGVINLSRSGFFSDRYLVGDIAKTLSTVQAVLAIILIAITMVLREPLSNISI